jgi:chemotaxis protein methyltransferase CheR
MNSLSDRLIEALLQRAGMLAEITKAKVQAFLDALPEAERGVRVETLLQAKPDEADWVSFVERFLIHETYFFRHEHQVEFLAKTVLPELLKERTRTGQSEFRIWCAACSSGEEAWTAALMLTDALKLIGEAGKGHWHFSIVGTDLSAEILLKAKRGEYTMSVGLNSFRDVPTFARHHFSAIFDGTSQTWKPNDSLRRIVSFQQRNIVTDPSPLSDVDLILCRNVLIYLDEPSIQQAFTKFSSALRPGGVLVLGPADMMRQSDGFDLLANERAMFWKKKSSGVDKAKVSSR